MTIQIPDAATIAVSVHGDEQHLFEPTAARCTTTTIASTCCWL